MTPVATTERSRPTLEFAYRQASFRDLPLTVSSWRSEQTLSDYLAANDVVGIADIDTRKLTRILREKGAQSGCIMAGEIDEAVDGSPLDIQGENVGHIIEEDAHPELSAAADVGKRNRASVFCRFPERKGVCRRAIDRFQAKGASA